MYYIFLISGEDDSSQGSEDDGGPNVYVPDPDYFPESSTSSEEMDNKDLDNKDLEDGINNILETEGKSLYAELTFESFESRYRF